MSKQKSKLKQMAEEGNPWAIQTLARLRAEAAAAAAAPAKPKDPAYREAMEAATDIRQWTDGPNPDPVRIWRLAEALRGR